MISQLRKALAFAPRALCVAFLCFATGCAYRTGATDRQIPGGYRAIAVPVFKNATPEVGVEVYFTNAFIRELERSRIGRLTNKSEAQVTLEGTIDSIRYALNNPVTNNDATGAFLPPNTVLTSEYRILVTTTLRLRRNSDQRILWEGTFNGERAYQAPKVGERGLTSANALYNHSARHQNLQAMAVDIMIEAHDRLTENF